MYDAIRVLIEKCLDANISLGLGVGRITANGGLELDTGLVVPADACLVPENIGGLELQLEEDSYILRRPMRAGDQVIWLQLDGNFLLLDRLGSVFAHRRVG